MQVSKLYRGGIVCFMTALFLVPCLGKPFMLNIPHLNREAQKVLGYNPDIELINGTENLDQITITCHGYGANKDIGFMVAPELNATVLTFNFPDHDLIDTIHFGTIHEYLPILFLLKACVVSGIKKINLYGFSAGGGAIINTLAILNSQKYTQDLIRIGVNREDVQEIVHVVCAGMTILDVPLKSVEEVLSIRPRDPVIKILAQRFKANGFEPIEVIDQLAGLKLNLLIYFEHHDQILSNRDDQLFYQKLKSVNKDGSTQLIMGSDGGHNGFHQKLWAAVKSLNR